MASILHLSLLVGLGTFFFNQSAALAGGKSWNVVVITADDMNADSTGWMGSKVGATPNIDALAATCHQFRNCHVAAPVCQASRSALMTGREPHRNGSLGFEPVRSDVPTLVEILSASGYYTAAINKTMHMMPRQKFNWDLMLEGSAKDPKAFRAHCEECIKAAQGKPFLINANSMDPHRPFPGDPAGQGDEDHPHGALMEKSVAAEAPVEMFSETQISVPSFLEDLPEVRQEMARYFSGVRRLDQSVGQLMDVLKGTGHLDDSVIIFLSDQGMSMPYAKATLYRYGTWSPVLLRWPGMGKPIVNTDVVSTIDLMPTILNLIDVKQPEGMDGASWLPLVQGEKQAGRTPVFTEINAVNTGRSFPSRCLRTNNRAYIWNAWPDGRTRFGNATMQKSSSWKAMVRAAADNPTLKSRVDHFIYRCAEELYDEESDPDERHNLINDPKFKTEVNQMRALLLEHMETTNDPQLAQFRRVKRSVP